MWYESGYDLPISFFHGLEEIKHGGATPLLTVVLCQDRHQTTLARDVDESSIQAHGISFSFLQRHSPTPQMKRGHLLSHLLFRVFP